MDTLDDTQRMDTTKDTDDIPTEVINREDLETFNDYMIEVSTALLGLESHDYFNKVIQTEENLSKIMAFVTDKHHRVLIVSKTEEFVKSADDENEEEGKSDTISTETKSKSMMNIELDLKVSYRGEETQSIAFIKRQQTHTVNLKEGKRSMSKQLQVINTGYAGEEVDLFRMANIYLDTGLIPLFTSYKARKSQDDIIYSHIDEIEQLLSKLRMEFVHCSQDQMSFEIKLLVDQRILTKRQAALDKGQEFTEDDFSDLQDDQAFIDSLLDNLKVWEKDIRKVTQMNTEFPIDSILTEISFWKNREHALKSIEEQIKSPEVQMVLSLLKRVKGTSMRVFVFENDIKIYPELKKAQE